MNRTHHELLVTLRIGGVEPERVTQLLGLTPTKSIRKGEPRVGRSGRRYADQPDHIWLLEEERASSGELSVALAKLLRDLGPRAEQLRAVASEARVDVFVGVFPLEANLGLSLDSAVLLDLGRLHLNVELDIYLPARPNEVIDEPGQPARPT